MRRTWTAVLLAMVSAAALSAAERPEAGTPGSDASIAVVEARCPTFSWSRLPGAESWRLAVYRVTEESLAAGPGVPVLAEQIPGGFLSWTPSLERCLARGQTYAWSIGAEGRRGKTVWSDPRIFRVAEKPKMELAEALAVVSRHLEESGHAEGVRETDRSPVERVRSAVPDGDAANSGRVPAQAPLAGTVLDLDGNLRLARSSPTVRLEDPAQSWDIIATSLGLFLADATGGGTQVSIFNGAPTGALEIRSTGVTIKNDLICTDCISSSDIANNSIQSIDIAPDSLGASKLDSDAVGSDELAQIHGVVVECNGGCGSLTGTQACQTLTGVGPAVPVGLSCAGILDISSVGSPCGGGSATCWNIGIPLEDGAVNLCTPSAGSGGDVIVWCLVQGSG